MAHKRISPDGLFDSSPFGFSQVVEATGRKLIFCAGQTANDKDLNFLGGNDLRAQLEASLENVRTALASAGAEPKEIVAMRTYIVDYTPDCLDDFSAVMNGFFDSENLPAATLIGVKALALPHFLCEIEVTAVVGD